MKSWFFIAEEEHKGILLILSFILGIMIYFSLPIEPSFLSLFLLFLGSFCLAFFFFFRQRFKFLSLILFFLLSGIFISKIHTSWMTTNFLEQALENVSVTGKIVSIEERLQSVRLVLENVLIEEKDQKSHLDKIRVWVAKKSIKGKVLDESFFVCQNLNELNEVSERRGLEKKSKKISTDTCVLKRPEPMRVQKGDWIRGKSFSLRPPSPPSIQGGYYEARTLFFEGIEAVGSFSSAVIIKKNEAKESYLDSFCHKLKEKLSFLSAETRGVIQALLLGDTGLITTPIEFLYRSLGLTHILSVSGFHVGLIAFLIYYFCRLILTIVSLKLVISPFVIRGISAIFALIISFFYVLLTGAEPPAVRAFIMTGFVFLCFLINRQTLSVRTVFIAAFLLLCYKPVLVLSVGFQLSFMAVLTLCVLVKNSRKKISSTLNKRPVFLFILGLILLNVLVTFVSIPFIAYHFHKIPIYGIVGNLLLSFLFSLGVMPLLVLGVLLMPFQMEPIFFKLAENALFLVHFIGEKIMLLPHLMVPVPSFSIWGLCVFSFGVILFSCMKGKTKYIGILLMVMLPFSFLTTQKSDLMLGRQGRLLAVRSGENNWLLNESYSHRIVSDGWLLSSAILPDNYVLGHVFKPDILVIKDKKISFDPKTCLEADLTFETRKKDYSICPNVISKKALKQMGTLELFVKEKQIILIDLSDTDRKRPWNQKKQERGLLF